MKLLRFLRVCLRVLSSVGAKRDRFFWGAAQLRVVQTDILDRHRCWQRPMNFDRKNLSWGAAPYSLSVSWAADSVCLYVGNQKAFRFLVSDLANFFFHLWHSITVLKTNLNMREGLECTMRVMPLICLHMWSAESELWQIRGLGCNYVFSTIIMISYTAEIRLHVIYVIEGNKRLT